MRWRFFECMNEATLRNTVCWVSMGNHEGKSSNGGSPTVGWHRLLPAGDGRRLPGQEAPERHILLSLWLGLGS